uniref:Uncharacterized protein n=1 Tax=Glossina pallidipes TaxID=7398 RepID=A0A1A9ZXY6_GLOPL
MPVHCNCPSNDRTPDAFHLIYCMTRPNAMSTRVINLPHNITEPGSVPILLLFLMKLLVASIVALFNKYEDKNGWSTLSICAIKPRDISSLVKAVFCFQKSSKNGEPHPVAQA